MITVILKNILKNIIIKIITINIGKRSDSLNCLCVRIVRVGGLFVCEDCSCVRIVRV